MRVPSLALRPTRRGLGAAVLVGALPGCAATGDGAAPARALPGRFVEAGDEAARWPDPAWWRGFGSPELDRLMARALAENLDLAQAEARLRQADASARIAGSALLPLVRADASAGRARSANVFGGARAPGRERYELGLAASYEVDFWGLNRSAAEAARLSAAARRLDLETIRITTQASVANGLVEVLEARDARAVQEENLAAARRLLSAVRAQLDAGTATVLDLAQQETVVAQQEAAVPPLRLAEAQGRAALATLLGLAPPELTIAPGGLDTLRVPLVSPGTPAELLARRPDVAAAEADLSAGRADVAAARAALLPSVALVADGGLASAALGTLLRPEAQFYSLLASLVQTVFDGGALRGQVALREGREAELLARYRLALLTALSDVEQSLAALRETGAQEALLTEAEARAARALAIAEAQFRAGVLPLVTLLSAQGALFSARRALAQGRAQRLRAGVGLFRALGGGWGPGDLPAVSA